MSSLTSFSQSTCPRALSVWRARAELVVPRAHAQPPAVGGAHERQIHGRAGVVATAPGDVGPHQVAASDALCPAHKRQRRPHGTVRVENEQAQPAAAQPALGPREVTGRRPAHQRPVAAVPGQAPAREVVLRAVDELDRQPGGEAKQVDQPGAAVGGAARFPARPSGPGSPAGPEDARRHAPKRGRAVRVGRVCVGQDRQREVLVAVLEARRLVHERAACRLPPAALEERTPAPVRRHPREAPALRGDDRRQQPPGIGPRAARHHRG